MYLLSIKKSISLFTKKCIPHPLKNKFYAKIDADDDHNNNNKLHNLMGMLLNFKCIIILGDKHEGKKVWNWCIWVRREVYHVFIENSKEQQLWSTKTQTCYKFWNNTRRSSKAKLPKIKIQALLEEWFPLNLKLPTKDILK